MNVPDKAAEIKAAVAMCIAFGTALFGWVGWVIIIWICAMIMDYITGTWSAMYRGEWSSCEARKGLWHKLGSIVAVCVAAMCDIALGVIVGNIGRILPGFEYDCVITPVVAVWYIFTELGSIIENASELGAPIPKFLKNIIAKVKDSADKR